MGLVLLLCLAMVTTQPGVMHYLQRFFVGLPLVGDPWRDAVAGGMRTLTLCHRAEAAVLERAHSARSNLPNLLVKKK